MKKSLFALAALGAFATAAQAQSSVTLYGALDSSIAVAKDVGMARGLTAPGAAPGAGNLTPAPGTTAGGTAFIDGSIQTSMWGMRGTESLGGGLNANFNLEGDASTNNGATDTRGVFRRGAWVGISGAFGQTKFGLQGNPIVATSAALLPVMGNVVNQQRSAVGYSNGVDNIKNAVGYTTPTINGFTASAVYGFSNTVDDQTGGSMYAANTNFEAMGFRLQAAYQKSNGTNIISGQNPSSALSAGGTNTTAEAKGGNTGYVAGVRYKIMPNLEIGYAYNNNEYTVDPTTVTPVSLTNASYSQSGNMFGIGYNMTPAILLGANYMTVSNGSTFTNLQSRYSFSKRTMVYAMATQVSNGNGAMGLTAGGKPIGNYQALQANTNSGVAANFSGLATAGTGIANNNSSAYQLGIIHTF